MDDQAVITSLGAQINPKIKRASLRYLPYPHSIYQSVFPEDLYPILVSNLPPTNDYTFSNRSYPERGFIFLGCNLAFQRDYSETYQALIRSYNHSNTIYRMKHPLWQKVVDWLLADSTLELWLRRYWPFIVNRFGVEKLKEMKFYQRTTLCRDLVGYQIPPHTDTPRKILTILFYMPSDDEHPEYGTEVLMDHRHRNSGKTDNWDSKHQDDWDDFEVHSSAPYLRNYAMDFFVGPESWHGVNRFGGPGNRDTIQVAIYGFTGQPSLG